MKHGRNTDGEAEAEVSRRGGEARRRAGARLRGRLGLGDLVTGHRHQFSFQLGAQTFPFLLGSFTWNGNRFTKLNLTPGEGQGNLELVPAFGANFW